MSEKNKNDIQDVAEKTKQESPVTKEKKKKPTFKTPWN